MYNILSLSYLHTTVAEKKCSYMLSSQGEIQKPFPIHKTLCAVHLSAKAFYDKQI